MTTSLTKTTTDIQPKSEAQAIADLSALNQIRLDTSRHAISDNSWKAYQKSWSRFERWCVQHRVAHLPASNETLQLFVTALLEGLVETQDGRSGKPVSIRTLDQFLAAILFVHKSFQLQAPVIPEQEYRAIRRKHGKAPKKKQAITQEELKAIVHTITPKQPTEGEVLRVYRDRAILLVAFASGGRRRSEIAGMQLEDLTRQADGSFRWVLQRSKTDQEGKGLELLIPVLPGEVLECPARTLQRWIEKASITTGPVFRSIDQWGNMGTSAVTPGIVARLVKETVQRLGLDPASYGGHSLRSGFATDMARKGVRLENIMQRTGHKSVAIAQGYVQAAQIGSALDPILHALGTKNG